MKFYLIVAKGKHKGLPIPITVDLFLIGSDRICQLRSGQPGIGQQQCALVRRERKIFVRDLDSGHPTLLNGEVMTAGEEWPVHAGDRLEVGPLEFMIQFREKPLSQRDLEEWALRCLDVSAERELFDEDADAFHQPTNASEAAASILDRLQVQRGLVMGRLRIGRDGNVTTVRFNDRHLVDEAEIALVNRELRENLSHPNLRVLLDFKNVRRMSTCAVKMIADLRHWLRSRDSTLALSRVRREMQDIMKTMHLQDIPLFHDKRTALAARW